MKCHLTGYCISECIGCALEYRDNFRNGGDTDEMFSEDCCWNAHHETFSKQFSDYAQDANTRVCERWLSEMAKRITPGRILDVGSALGTFLQLAEARAWTALGGDLRPFTPRPADVIRSCCCIVKVVLFACRHRTALHSLRSVADERYRKKGFPSPCPSLWPFSLLAGLCTGLPLWILPGFDVHDLSSVHWLGTQHRALPLRGYERLWESPDGTRPPFVAVILVTNLVNLLALSRQVATTALDFAALVALRNIRGDIPDEETIHIRDAKDTPLLWMTYFMKDYNLSFSHYTPYYPRRDWLFYQDAISSDLVLVNRDVSLAAPWASETVYENSHYRILRKDARILAHLDFQEGGQALKPGDTMRLNGLVDRLAVDGQAFTLAPHVQRGEVLRLGVLAAAGSVVKHNVFGQEETIRLAQDVSALDWPIRGELSRISLTNESARPLRLLGWLEVVAEGWRAGSGPAIPGIFEWYQEEVMPHSGLFVVSGWHSLEEGQRRWTKEESLAIFRNPRRPVVLAIEGVIRPYPDVTPPTKATIWLNGHALGEVGSVPQFP